jgi:hypothetical protein
MEESDDAIKEYDPDQELEADRGGWTSMVPR